MSEHSYEELLQTKKTVKRPNEPRYEVQLMVKQDLGKEMQQFEDETRYRKIISELVRPFMQEADLDRRQNAMLEMKITNYEERLQIVEHLFGMSEVKPRIFQQIDDQFCDLRIEFKDKFKEAADSLIISQQRNEQVLTQVKDFEQTLISIQKLIQLRGQECSEIRQTITNLTEDTAYKFQTLRVLCQKLEMTVESKMSLAETRTSSVISQLNVLENMFKNSESTMQQLYKLLNENRFQIEKLQLEKVDLNEFDRKYQVFQDQLESIRYAVFDNFKVVKATDNYIEKYLPFRIQNMISKNLLAILPDPPKYRIDENGILHKTHYYCDLTQKEKEQLQQLDNFKKTEYDVYKEIHKVVLSDDGNPILKKSAFKMPGYRQIIGKRILNEYEIDNTITGQNDNTLEEVEVQLVREESVGDSDISEELSQTDEQSEQKQKMQFKTEVEQVNNLQKMFSLGKKQPESQFFQIAIKKAKTLQSWIDEGKDDKQMKNNYESPHKNAEHSHDISQQIQLQQEGPTGKLTQIRTSQSSSQKQSGPQLKTNKFLQRKKTIPIESQIVSNEVYHERRCKTKYMVGLQDLEEELRNMILTAKEDVKIIQGQVMQTGKDLFSFKRYIETVFHSRDQKFENEVRSCLVEQQHYLDELHSQMRHTHQTSHAKVQELTWHLHKNQLSKEVSSLKLMSPREKRDPNWRQVVELMVDFLKIQNILNLEFNQHKFTEEHVNEEDKNQSNISQRNVVIQMIDQIRNKFEEITELVSLKPVDFSIHTWAAEQNNLQNCDNSLTETAINGAETPTTAFMSLPVHSPKQSTKQNRSHLQKRLLSANSHAARNVRQHLQTPVEHSNRITNITKLTVKPTSIKLLN